MIMGGEKIKLVRAIEALDLDSMDMDGEKLVRGLHIEHYSCYLSNLIKPAETKCRYDHSYVNSLQLVYTEIDVAGSVVSDWHMVLSEGVILTGYMFSGAFQNKVIKFVLNRKAIANDIHDDTSEWQEAVRNWCEKPDSERYETA